MTEPTPLQRLWLTETVRLREEQAGSLEDLEANRRARAAGGDLATRIQNRALWLAERDGQLAALRHWLQGARLALLLLAMLAVLSGAGLAFAALGNGPLPVNVFWALGSLLALNLLLLASWGLGLFFAGDHSASLGDVARHPALRLRLGNHHSRWRHFRRPDPRPRRPAGSAGLQRAQQSLGFSVPSEAMIRASGNASVDLENARQAWAGWLVGVLVVYGVLPRLLLALLCLWRWRVGVRELTLEPNLPGYAQLRERLMPSSERLGISDAAPAQLPNAEAGVTRQDSAGALLVAIELDDQRPWPPALPRDVRDAGILDSRESRQKLLEQLSRFPPARLAIACDPRRSPDRGSLALIAELARSAAATRVWLLQAPQGQALDADRLGDWHNALQQLELPFADSAPLTWLETGHD